MSASGGAVAAPVEYAVWHGSRVEYAPLPVSMVTDRRFADKTVRVYAYFIGVVTRPVSTNPSGRWALRKKDVLRQCGCGEEGWARAIRELTAAGLYVGHRFSHPRGATAVRDGVEVAVGGQKGFVHHVYPWESPFRPASSEPPPAQPGGGSPPGGEAPPLGLRENASEKKEKKQKHARATRDAGESIGEPKAAAAVGGEKKEYSLRPSGIETWWRREAPSAFAIESSETPEAIRAAVEELKKRGKFAVPGSVRAEIDRQARAQRDAEARRKNEEALARSAAENARRHEAELAAWLAARSPEEKKRDEAWLASCKNSGGLGTV